MDTNYIIETKNLTKQYGSQKSVADLNIHVKRGRIYGLLGRNGAGKTTTMKMLLGLTNPTSGEVKIWGKPLQGNEKKLLPRIGSLIESPAGYLHLTAQENLEIVADLKGVPHKDIGRVLDIVHLTQDRNRRVGQYSLGMKQRLGIAMALLGSPKLLILDEPTNGLDPAGIQEMRALIRNMPAATGATVLISSHLLGEMEQMVEQVGIIDHGHILFEGPLTELQRHSRGNVTLRLLDPAKAAPILRANGLTAHSDSCVVTLPPLQDALLADLVQKLAACGAGVVELTPRTKTLEEIFLSLTSEEAD